VDVYPGRRNRTGHLMPIMTGGFPSCRAASPGAGSALFNTIAKRVSSALAGWPAHRLVHRPAGAVHGRNASSLAASQGPADHRASLRMEQQGPTGLISLCRKPFQIEVSAQDLQQPFPGRRPLTLAGIDCISSATARRPRWQRTCRDWANSRQAQRNQNDNPAPGATHEIGDQQWKVHADPNGLGKCASRHRRRSPHRRA